MPEPAAGTPPPLQAGFRPVVVTTLAVFASMLAFSRQPFLSSSHFLIFALGGAYLLCGYLIAGWYDRTASPPVLGLLFAVEILLGGLIVYRAAHFFLAGLILLPLMGLGVWTLPPRGVWGMGLVLTAVLSLAYGAAGGAEAALQAGIGYLAAVVFVGFVTRSAQREQQARAEAERLAARLETANRQLRHYAAQSEELAITRERTRLAREIHDTVGHTLSALDVQIELLVRLPADRREQRRQAAEQARSLVKEGLTEVRRAVQALRPMALETFSLPEAVAALVTDFDEAARSRAVWQVEGAPRPLPPRLAIPLYRAAQEALTNIRHHAPAARRVRVQLCYEAERVRLTVENDGLTPAPSPGGKGVGGEGGYGLRGLRERAEAQGGCFSAGPDGAGNFRVEMQLPLPAP